jgi:hypothetical protein
MFKVQCSRFNVRRFGRKGKSNVQGSMFKVQCLTLEELEERADENRKV